MSIQQGAKVWVKDESHRFVGSGKNRKPLPYTVNQVTVRVPKEGEEWKPIHDSAVITLDDGRIFEEGELRICRNGEINRKPHHCSRQKRDTVRRMPHRNSNGCHSR